MAIDKVRCKSGEGYDIFYVDSFSEHFKEIIKADLAGLCHGPRFTSSSIGLFTYEKTIQEFYRRYDSKTEKLKTGIIGELMAHTIIKHHLSDLTPISVIFNLGDGSIKKGFDLNFVKGDERWYGEVKSSRAVKNLHVDNKSLLTDAKTDLVEKFTDGKLRDAHWQGAMYQVATMFSDHNRVHKLSELLDMDLKAAEDVGAKIANVILISVPFHSTTLAEIQESDIQAYLTKLRSQGVFKTVSIICIQKSLFDAVVEFVREEAERCSEY